MCYNLFYNEEDTGILLFSIKDRNFLNNNSLVKQISSSLKAKKLITELEESKVEIKSKSSKIEENVLPMLDLIKKIASESGEKMQRRLEIRGKVHHSIVIKI